MATYYRLRSVRHLLGRFRELERQQIYFASPDELNDPTEGLAYIVWRGDQIAWRNFFTHYVRCLHTMCIRAKLGADVQQRQIPVLDPLDNDLPSQYTGRVADIVSAVFDNLRLDKLIKDRLTYQRTIRIEEVTFWLQHVHSRALIDIRSAYLDHNDRADATRLAGLAGQLDLSTLVREMHGIAGATLESSWEDAMRYSAAQDLARKCELKEPKNALDTTSRLLVFDFPSLYLKELERLLYPSWYVACFMDSYHNSSAWGHYGDGHRGVCLVFETTQASCGERQMVLRPTATRKGHSNDIDASFFTFRPVRYHKTRPEVEFFCTINRLPEQILLKQWFTDDDGNLSRCAARVTSDENADQWRRAYRNRFFRNVTSKSSDWQYESESRLVVYDEGATYRKQERRQFRYSLRSLRGIIFGVATADSDKVKIVDIVRRKCLERGRTGFRFYQAYYCGDTGRIRRYELALPQNR